MVSSVSFEKPWDSAWVLIVATPIYQMTGGGAVGSEPNELGRTRSRSGEDPSRSGVVRWAMGWICKRGF